MVRAWHHAWSGRQSEFENGTWHHAQTTRRKNVFYILFERIIIGSKYFYLNPVLIRTSVALYGRTCTKFPCKWHGIVCILTWAYCSILWAFFSSNLMHLKAEFSRNVFGCPSCLLLETFLACKDYRAWIPCKRYIIPSRFISWKN